MSQTRLEAFIDNLRIMGIMVPSQSYYHVSLTKDGFTAMYFFRENTLRMVSPIEVIQSVVPGRVGAYFLDLLRMV